MSPAPGARHAEVLCIGDELLSGRVSDINAAWLGGRLAEHGWPVRRVVMVPDDVEVIVGAIHAAVARAALVVVAGGLGGTSDDVTRSALARVAGVGVVRDPDLEAAIVARYAATGSEPSAGGLAMADVVEGAEVLANPAGTAPGFRLLLGPDGTDGSGGTVVVALPGVPAEMRAITETWVLPSLTSAAVVTRSLWLPAADESRVGDVLAGVERGLGPGVRIGYLAAAGSVEVRLTASGEDADAAGAVLDPVLAAARAALLDLPDALVLDRPLSETVVSVLRGAGQTVAVAESLTGGLVAAELVSVPGASAVLRGGVVAYSTDLKATLLGVPEELLRVRGAVDSDVALAMARGVRERLGAEWGVSTTGVAGPQPQDGRPVGEVHVAVSGPVSVARVLQLRGGRELIRTQSGVAALRLLAECLQ